MKPRPFDYVRPDTVDEALALLAEYGDDARILAGGQSLVPMLNLRLIDASVLIDISRIAELDVIRDLGQAIEIGAAVTQNKLMAWPPTQARKFRWRWRCSAARWCCARKNAARAFLARTNFRRICSRRQAMRTS
jgi:xanthine dehydrogenase iron-sulfur cluster and FAD-binding subunit A